MTSDSTHLHPTVRTLLRINQLCDEFEAAQRTGAKPALEDYVDRAPADAAVLLEYLIPIEISYRQRDGQQPTLEEYVSRFPVLDRDLIARLLKCSSDTAIPAVLGEYELVRPIGSGGMGSVYLARHRRMNRLVALKAITPDALDREILHQRFAREIEITALLSHPNVVTAFDAREDQGVSYLITEYLEGGDLGRLVKQSGPLSVADTIRSVRGAALGLAHAHAQNVIHRDVKPSNLLLNSSGQVCVADWGLAKSNASTPANSKLTAAGMILGTVDYLAPELAGKSEDANARSDIYSLGCVIFYLLARRPPFATGSIMDRLDAHRDTPAPDIRSIRQDIPDALAELLIRMLAKQPEDRPADLESVIASLDQLNRPEIDFTFDSTIKSPVIQFSNRGFVIGSACVVLLLLGFLLWYWWPTPAPLPFDQKNPLDRKTEAPEIAEMPVADPRAYQQRWADHLGIPVERTFTIDGVDFPFILVPPGTFSMGSPESIISRLTANPDLDNWKRAMYLAEQERCVTIRRPFYLAKFETTFAQFQRFIERTNHITLAERTGEGWGYPGPGLNWQFESGRSWKSGGTYIPAGDHPVINTAWNDTIAYCKWFGQESHLKCRLPSESEWEFACRGGRSGIWSHGDDPELLNQYAVYGVEVPAAVGTRKPNGFGLFDMPGNASERCALEDPWTADPFHPTELGASIYPVRGGRFNELPPESESSWPEAYRSARRTWEAQNALTAVGRVLLEIPGTSDQP